MGPIRCDGNNSSNGSLADSKNLLGQTTNVDLEDGSCSVEAPTRMKESTARKAKRKKKKSLAASSPDTLDEDVAAAPTKYGRSAPMDDDPGESVGSKPESKAKKEKKENDDRKEKKEKKQKKAV